MILFTPAFLALRIATKPTLIHQNAHAVHVVSGLGLVLVLRPGSAVVGVAAALVLLDGTGGSIVLIAWAACTSKVVNYYI